MIPERQVRGVGPALVREALGRCARAGHRIVVLLGHPNYHPRFRFSAGRARGLSSALSGEAFMTLELAPVALPRVAGEFEFAPPFGEVS